MSPIWLGLRNALLKDLGTSARDLMREQGRPAAELGLLSPDLSNKAIVEAIVEHPVLVNRPIVAMPIGVKLYRLSQAVLDLLDKKPTSYTKEDGAGVSISP
ncbi:MAG: arsenate reductase [Pseudomonadota bacterium]|jgi:arsenate reductase